VRDFYEHDSYERGIYVRDGYERNPKP